MSLNLKGLRIDVTPSDIYAVRGTPSDVTFVVDGVVINMNVNALGALIAEWEEQSGSNIHDNNERPWDSLQKSTMGIMNSAPVI